MPTDPTDLNRRDDGLPDFTPTTPPTDAGQVGGTPAAVIGDPNSGRPIEVGDAPKDMDPAEAEWEKRIKKPLGTADTTEPKDADPSA